MMFFCSWKAILTDLLLVIYCSVPVSHVISLSYIHGRQIKEVEVFCRLDPPPPYETVCSLKGSEQVWAMEIKPLICFFHSKGEVALKHGKCKSGGYI